MPVKLKVLLIGFFVILLSCKRLSDSSSKATPIDEFSAPFYFGMFSVSPENPLTNEGVELGRMLFYETMLSRDSTISCGSCHQQAMAFTDGKKLAIGIRGQVVDRNTISLVNMLWSTPHKFWDGRAKNLEDQALQPISNPKETSTGANRRPPGRSMYFPGSEVDNLGERQTGECASFNNIASSGKR